MTQYLTRGVGYSATSPSEGMLLLREKWVPQDHTHHGILCFHGHGSSCDELIPYGDPAITAPGYHAWQLAEAGFLIEAIDDAGGTAWGNQSAVDRATDGFNFLTGSAGAKAGKIGIMAWSMGAAAALNFIKQNPTLVAGAWLWAPLTDLDWAQSTAGYTPAYGGAVANTAAWTTEIGAAYNPYATASNGFRIRDEYASWRGLGIPIRCAHALDDATIPVAQTRDGFVPGVNDPNVTFRSVASGGHTGLFSGVPASELISFFGNLAW